MKSTHAFATRVYFRVFLSLTPRTREKTHELRVHVYTFLYTRAGESRCTRKMYTATFYSLAS